MTTKKTTSECALLLSHLPDDVCLSAIFLFFPVLPASSTPPCVSLRFTSFPFSPSLFVLDAADFGILLMVLLREPLCGESE